MSVIPFLIAGERVAGQHSFESVNPATGKLNYYVSAAGASDVDRCVAAASAAVKQASWANLRPHNRAKLLHAISDGIIARSEILAAIQMRENGKVVAECRAQVASAAATFRYYAAVCETLGSDVTPSRGDYLSFTIYEPLGVVAAITPWNSPLTMEAQKVAPALAAGNAVIVKPSEVTPTAALEIADIALASGLPPGILNVLTGTGREVGEPLVRHPGVRMISFTGGTETGRAIARQAAERLVPVALELGGKSPHIVFKDAALDEAIAAVTSGIFEGTGQSCVAGSRVFVQRPILNEVIFRLTEQARNLRVGAPTDPKSQMGPLATFRHRETVERFVASALDQGGEILAGGVRPEAADLATGAFYLPTIVGGLDASARVCQEEIFGPVLCVLPFDDEDDLIEQANSTAYGLACGIWTSDYRRALRVARAIEAGTVWLNTYKQLSIATPFGGYKESGLGREKGLGGMRLYQQCKSLYLGGVTL